MHRTPFSFELNALGKNLFSLYPLKGMGIHKGRKAELFLIPSPFCPLPSAFFVSKRVFTF